MGLFAVIIIIIVYLFRTEQFLNVSEMWSFFSKDPSKELVNFEIQEAVPLEHQLQEKTIWSVNNAKKKGTQQTEAFTVFSYQTKPGNEAWVT